MIKINTKSTRHYLAALSIFIFNNANAIAESSQGIGIDYLHGEGKVNGLRLVYHPYINKINDEIAKAIHVTDIDMNFELSFNLWRFGEDNNYDNNLAIAFSPVFSRQFSTIYGKPLKWEAGIGLSLVDDTKFAGKDIGSHYQFEDRIGLKILLDEHLNKSISIRYIHYSNGGLNDKNPGLDFFNVAYMIQF